MDAVASPPAFGDMLRGWRQRLRWSQLELSLASGVSARHVSFIETGRARPSRDMVLRLADQMQIPLRDRNSLLLAAGYAPAFGARSLDDGSMEPIRNAITVFLRAHEPHPALVVDRNWDLIAANESLQVLTDGVAPELFEPPANTLRICLHPRGMAPHITNFPEWSAHIMQRLRNRAASSGDAEARRLYEELSTYPGVSTDGDYRESGTFDILVPLRLRTAGGDELSFISAVSSFVTAADVTLSELSLEAFYPADAATAQHLHSSGAG